MASKRKFIRKAIRNVLLGRTDAGINVFTNLSSPTWRENLPAIIIYTRSEDIVEMNVAPREYRRNLELAIEIEAEGSEDPNSDINVEDILDDLADQVEKELNRDETLGEIENALGKKEALVDELVLSTAEFQYEDGGAKPVGSARLIYNVVYHEMRPGSLEEQDGVSDLERVHAQWRVGHDNSEPDNVVEAENDIEIPD